LVRIEFYGMMVRWQLASIAALVCTGLGADLLLSARYYPVTEVLTSKLERRFATPVATDMVNVEGIIALGGGHARIVEAVRLAVQHPNAKLVVTGASADDEAYAQTQGLPPGQLLLESRAKSTFENAIFSRRLLQPEPSTKWLLVTSAVHMPRAVGAFREAGFSVVAWPVFDRPTVAADVVRSTSHEILGLIEYWLLGRTDAAFPAPIG
jgi:uncharacterized SAM-binding protein YcdF (DUF218 family)